MLGKKGIKRLDSPVIKHVDAVTLYANPNRQKSIYSYILSLKPRRIIFNQGTENHGLKMLAEKQNLRTIGVCTLVMLSIRNY